MAAFRTNSNYKWDKGKDMAVYWRVGEGGEDTDVGSKLNGGCETSGLLSHTPYMQSFVMGSERGSMRQLVLGFEVEDVVCKLPTVN